MGARVLFRDSQGRDGQVILNPATPLYVGRALDCAVRTDDAMVSRKHSIIRMENGRFYVEDLGSSNGTHVNDARITRHPLSHNDVIRCGSLWLRYIEDVPPAAAPGWSAERPGAGFQRMDPSELGPGPGSLAAPEPQDGRDGAGGHDNPGAAPAQRRRTGRSPGRGRSGGRPMLPGQGIVAYPAQPSQQAHPAGHRDPAGVPGVRHGPVSGQRAPAAESQLFGGPPALRVSEVAGGQFIMPPRSPDPPIDDEDSIVIDIREGYPNRLREELDETLAALEKLQIGYDRAVADGKRLRAELIAHEARADELRRDLAERDETVEAHGRVADELREELRQAKDSLAAARSQAAELADLVAAAERQLAGNQDEIGRLEREIHDKERQLADLSRSREEGWRRLEEQLAEIERLREVITGQERLLEERRVGFTGQEEIIEELRADKEQQLRAAADREAERDELRSALGRLNAQVAAIDEENRRLIGLMSELQGRGGPSGQEDAAAAALTPAIAAELKSLRIAVKTVESDRDHLKQLSERAESEVERLRQRLVRLEVEVRGAHDELQQVQAGKSVSDEALTRAERDRHRAAEDAVKVGRERDEARQLAAEIQRELDKARRRIAELEEDTQSEGMPPEAVVDENRQLERKLGEARETIAGLEAAVRTARAEAKVARRAGAPTIRPPARSDTARDGVEATAVVAPGRNPGTIKDRALEVHDGINVVLSELRSNAMILHDEFGKLASGRSPDSSRIMKDVIELLLGQAEEAKGVLRKLRELVESGDE